MNYKLFGGWFRSVVAMLLPALALVATQSAHGATIPLPVSYPAIDTKYTNINYVYTGSGGTMTINGYQSGGTALQTITFDGSTSYRLRTPADGALTLFTLTANFNASGAFVSTGSTLTIGGVVDTSTAAGIQPYAGLANSGTLLTANLTDFGFYGHASTSTSDVLEIDFLISATGGDLFNAGYGPGEGLRWTGNVSTGNPLAPPVGGVWSSAAFTNTAGFSCSGTACASQLTTYVPVPAAVWLFGSGLLGLFGIATRRRATRAG